MMNQIEAMVQKKKGVSTIFLKVQIKYLMNSLVIKSELVGCCKKVEEEGCKLHNKYIQCDNNINPNAASSS